MVSGPNRVQLLTAVMKMDPFATGARVRRARRLRACGPRRTPVVASRAVWRLPDFLPKAADTESVVLADCAF